MQASRKSAVRFALLTLVVLAACQDASQSPTAPVIPQAPQAARSPVAQARLEAIFQRTSPEVMALPGTVFADNDEAVGKVVFGVENAAAIIGVQNALSRLGLDESDYAIEVTQPIVQVATLRDVIRPVVAGLQIHFSRYVCSIGFNATAAGQASFVTASHCTASQGGTEGTLYYQPTSSVASTAIAREVSDPAYVKNGPGCPKGKKCRYSDAARAAYINDTDWSPGTIAKTTGANNGSLTISSSGNFSVTSQDNTTKNFAEGTVLNKVGRTSGWSQGPVDRSCVNTSVAGSTVYLFCQTFVNADVAGGDSGSGVFRITSGDNVQIVGILWGGASDGSYFVFSPLSQVQQELGSLTATK